MQKEGLTVLISDICQAIPILCFWAQSRIASLGLSGLVSFVTNSGEGIISNESLAVPQSTAFCLEQLLALIEIVAALLL